MMLYGLKRAYVEVSIIRMHANQYISSLISTFNTADHEGMLLV